MPNVGPRHPRARIAMRRKAKTRSIAMGPPGIANMRRLMLAVIVPSLILMSSAVIAATGEGVDGVRLDQLQRGKIVKLGVWPCRHIYSK